MAGTSWQAVLVGAAVPHVGFQLTVTGLVYPALAEVPEAGTRPTPATPGGSCPLVAVVYGGVVVTGVTSLAAALVQLGRASVVRSRSRRRSTSES